MIGNNEILNYLLIKEDFLPEPTGVGDGKITIGSGLTDSKWLDLYRKRGNKWSKEDNRKAVLEEIQKRRLWAEQNVPHWNILPEPSQDALLSYRYNYNFTPKNSPKLFKALEDKNYLEAARQMDATSKNSEFKNGLQKRRKEEQQWFLSGFPELSKPNGFAVPYKYPVPKYPTVAESYRKSMAPITDNYSQGGQLQNHKQWKDLSYSEKNDIIKVAVRNGITTLPEIRQKYNEFADGGNLYAKGGYVYDMLPQLFASDGVQVRVTSGYRPNSRVQGSGKPSRHSMHEAADIVGDFSAIRRVLDNPESNTAKWMRANGYGYLDETSKTGTKKFWHDQKGDHSHYHIGKDSGIAKKFATSTGITSNAIPIVSSGNYLDIAKAHIRNNEGWSPMPVADGPKNTGWRSVGYGFNDSGFRAKYPQGISKAYENGITKAQAEQELDYILGNMDSHLRRVYGSKWNSFNDNQKAAILDTYYQRPASVVGRNSAFYNAVMRGDNNAVNYLGVAGYNTRNNDRRKLFSSTAPQMPEATQTVQQPIFYQPWNPQAASLYTPYSPLTPYPAPIFSPEEQEEYFAKQIAQAQKQQEAEQREKQRQEKADRINRFSMLMNLTDPYSSDNSSSSSTPFADAVSMLTQRNPIPYFSDGGSIHIKPENRGKFTRLKERTGHSASWFKENGTPEQKKMAIFALNSKHWKHGLGGNLFEGGGDTKANIPVTYFTQSEAMPLLADNPNRTAVLDEVTVKPYKKLPMQSELFQGITNQSANEKADEFANRTSLTPERFLGLMGANVPLAAGALGATVAAPALFDSTAVPLYDYITSSSIAGVPTTTWLNTGMEAGFAGHGLNHAVNEGIDGWGDAAITALEITPLGRVIKPIIKETAAAVEKYRHPLGRPQIPDEYLTIKPQIKSYDNSVTKVPFFTWGNDSRFKVSPTKEFYKELYSQLSAAKKYKESPEYADLVRKAAQESENLGIGDFPEDLFTAPNGKSLKLIFEDRPKGELGEYVPKDNVMRLDMLQSEDMEVPYHEGIHWQRVGNPDNIGPNFSKWWKARESGQSDDIQQKLFESFRNSEEYNRYIKRRNADRYLEYKVNNALYPFADAYLRARGELQAHGLEAGRAIGLKPFLPYPGMKSALNAIDKARSYNPYLNDVKSGGEENVKRFWDILTGQYAPSLILSGLTSTGYGLTNK